MNHSDLFDAVVRDLGFKNGSRLAQALGRKKPSATNWRYNGFPKVVIGDLIGLSARRGQPFSAAVRAELDRRLMVPSRSVEAA